MNIKVFQLSDLEFGIMQLEFMIKEEIVINSHSFVHNLEYEISETEGKNDFQLLAEVWNHLNRDDRPKRMEMRSLSISDVVVLDDKPYLCTVNGWKPINFNGRETVRLR